MFRVRKYDSMIKTAGGLVMNFLKKHTQRVREQMSELKWNILALYLARRDPRIPLRSKILVAVAVAYLLTPIDLIPDFIPVIGQLEDIVIVPALLGFAMRSIPPELLREYKEKAKLEFREGSPKSYIGMVMVVAVWVLIILLVTYLILKSLSIL